MLCFDEYQLFFSMKEYSSPLRRAAKVYAATIAMLLLAGYGCGLPGAENDDGLTDGVRDPNNVTVTVPAQPDAKPAAATNAPAAPKADGDTTEKVEWIQGDPTVSFAHVHPGVSSEFYLDFTTGAGPVGDGVMNDPNQPPDLISVQIDGPGVMGDDTVTKPFLPNHPFHLIFPINRFGTYVVTGDIMEGGHSVSHFTEKKEVK
jgi:hypothetical protein